MRASPLFTAGVSYAPVSGGISNSNGRVTASHGPGDWFVKVPGNGTEMFIDRVAAMDASRKAAAAGLGPRVFEDMAAQGVEINDFMTDRRASTHADFADPAKRVAAIAAYTRMHGREAVVPYEADEVTRRTVGGLRDWLLAADTAALARVAPGLTPEMVAAVSKLMRNQDLIRVARKARVVTRFRNTLGLAGRLSTRMQPNHPAEELRGITVAVLAEAQAAGQSLARGTVGQNVMNFETGQRAALSANAYHGVDQQTLEARACA